MGQKNFVWLDKNLLSERLNVDYYDVETSELISKIYKQPYKVLSLREITFKCQSEPQTVSTMFTNIKDEDHCYAVIRMKNLKFFYIDESDLGYISLDDFNILKEFELKPGVIVFGLTGVTLGQASVVPYHFAKGITNRRIAQIQLKEWYDPYYVTSFLNTEYGQRQLYKFTTGVAQPNLRLEDSLEVLLPIPPKSIQDHIGNKIRKAEELSIEAKKLREEAEFLFQDFIGVLNSNKRMIKNTPVKVLDNDTWAPMFFDSLQIGEGSNLTFVTLNNVTKSIKCGEPVKKGDRQGQSYPFYGASGISDTIGSYNFDGQYLIIAQDGSIGCVSVANGKFWANNHVWIVEANEGWNLYFLKLYLNRYPYWYCLTTGSVVPKVTSENLRKLLVPVTPIEIQNRIGNRLANAEERQSLAERLIQEAKRDIEDLIEGKFDESKISTGM